MEDIKWGFLCYLRERRVEGRRRKGRNWVFPWEERRVNGVQKGKFAKENGDEIFSAWWREYLYTLHGGNVKISFNGDEATKLLRGMLLNKIFTESKEVWMPFSFSSVGL